MAAQASLDDAIIGDPITSPVALAAILDFFAGQLAVPPDADAAVTVLQGVQARGFFHTILAPHGAMC